MKNTNYLEKVWAKVVGTVVLCVTGAIICLCVTGLFSMSNIGSSTRTSYFQTQDCANHARALGYNVNSTYAYHPREMNRWFSSSQQNALITVYEYHADDEQYELVWSNEKEGSSIGYRTSIYAHQFDDELVQYEQMTAWEYDYEEAVGFEQDTEDQIRIFRTDIEVLSPITIKDDYFYNGYMIYSYFEPYQNQFMLWLIVSSVLFCATLVFMLWSAGHKESYEGIYETIVDRIPYEIVGVVCFGGILLCAIPVAEIIREYSLASFIQYGLVVCVIALMVAGLFFLLFLMTTATRLKAHHFLTSSFIGRLCLFGKDIIVSLPMIPKAVALIVIYAGLVVWFLEMREQAIVAILTVLFGGLWLYMVYSMKELEIGGEIIASGNKDYQIPLKRLRGPFYKHGENLNSINQSISEAVEKEMRSERLKTELITNVSHDIKTPLTSIINYVDLLQKEHTPEQETEYLEILQKQSQRLKKLTEDVVEASKASSGAITVQLERTNVKEILDQAIAEYQEKLEERQLQLLKHLPEDDVIVQADGTLLWRVIRNLLGNISKYSQPQSRVYVDVLQTDFYTTITFKNTSQDELNISTEELMERFVRGDASRHTEGSGLGLNIARSLVELMGGTFEIIIDGDLFKTTIQLNNASSEL